MGICPSLEVVTENQNFLENPDRDLSNFLVQSCIYEQMTLHILMVTMSIRRGRQNEHLGPNQNFEISSSAGNLKSNQQETWNQQLNSDNWFISSNEGFQPVWHSHNIRDIETGSLFWCLAVESLLVHSYPLLCLQGQDRLAKLAFLVLNVINLALFQAGWSKKFIWPFSRHFLALFGFLLKLLSGNPGISCQTSKRFVLLLVFIM